MKDFNYFIFSFGLLFNAQTVKIKRGIVDLEGIHVAKLSNKGGIYTFMDLKETPIYTIEFVDKSVVDSVRDSYIKLKEFIIRIKRSIWTIFLHLHFQGRKSAAYTCVKSLKIIDERGINIKNLDELFKNSPKRKLDTKTKMLIPSELKLIN
jgi:hypothetical protein